MFCQKILEPLAGVVGGFNRSLQHLKSGGGNDKAKTIRSGGAGHALLAREAAGGASSPPISGRYLSFAEREHIALYRAKGWGIREIAGELARTASTISRELRRNAATRSGNFEYRATTLKRHAATCCRIKHPLRPRNLGLLKSAAKDRLVALADGCENKD